MHFTSIVYRLVFKGRGLFTRITRKRVTVSVGDLMMSRGRTDGVQFIVASRLLDLEAYINNGDESFNYQRLLSDNRNYDNTSFNQSFVKLIKSYHDNGYDKNSRVLLDRDFLLRNGTHRMAIHLFMHIDEIEAVVVGMKYPKFDGLFDWYRDMLSSCTIDLIMQKLWQIQDDLLKRGISFSAIIPIQSSLEQYLFNIIEDVHVLREVPLSSLEEGQSVRGILFLHTKATAYKFVQFSLEDPQYEVFSGYIQSRKIRRQRLLKSDDSVYISSSCYEGKRLFDSVRPFFREDYDVS